MFGSITLYTSARGTTFQASKPRKDFCPCATCFASSTRKRIRRSCFRRLTSQQGPIRSTTQHALNVCLHPHLCIDRRPPRRPRPRRRVPQVGGRRVRLTTTKRPGGERGHPEIRENHHDGTKACLLAPHLSIYICFISHSLNRICIARCRTGSLIRGWMFWIHSHAFNLTSVIYVSLFSGSICAHHTFIVSVFCRVERLSCSGGA